MVVKKAEWNEKSKMLQMIKSKIKNPSIMILTKSPDKKVVTQYFYVVNILDVSTDWYTFHFNFRGIPH